MATCPRCKSRSNFTLTRTGATILVTGGLTAASLSGSQPKVSARERLELKLTCACGWEIRGYRQGGNLVEYPPGQTPETKRSGGEDAVG